MYASSACLTLAGRTAGTDYVDSLAAAYAASAESSSSSSSSSGLGSCLLGDLPTELATDQAIAILHQWTTVTDAGTERTEALQGLAAAWQPPVGAKKLTKKQLPAIERLRGLVMLGRAAAVDSGPERVLEVRGFCIVLIKESAECITQLGTPGNYRCW
jgi:hypothetical protein